LIEVLLTELNGQKKLAALWDDAFRYEGLDVLRRLGLPEP
jgi:hypothetical protein